MAKSSKADKASTHERRIQQALADIFTDEDTCVKKATILPSSVDKRSNAQVKAFHEQHDAVGRLFIAKVMHTWTKKEYDDARAEVSDMLGLDVDELGAGTHPSHHFDNVNLGVRVNNPQSRIDTTLLRNTLITRWKFSAEDAEAVISAATVEGKMSLHLLPTVTA